MENVKSKESTDEILSLPFRGFEARKIHKKTCEFYGVRVGYDSNGNIASHYYPYDDGKSFKVRQLPKTFTWVNHSKKLFGIEKFQSGGRRLIITEGEIDCLTVAQASFEKYGKFYPVVGLSSSVMTDSILLDRDWVRSFKEVILCFDEDEAGKKAVDKAIKIIGIDKVKITKLPKNDANDTFLEFGKDALLNAIWDASPYIPKGIISNEELWAALESYNSIPSHPYPECLEGVNSKLKGKRSGEIVLFISGTGCFAKGTEILKSDGSIEKVENIVEGDVLLNADGQPTKVKTLFRGREKMATVTLRDGTSFTCNMSHILTVVNNDGEGRWGLKKNQLIDVSVSEYLTWSDKRKHLSKAFKARPLDFPKKELLIDPYVLGVWLGDGYSDGGRFSCQNSDSVIIDTIIEKGYNVTKAVTPFAWNSLGRLRFELKSMGLVNNKHIPENYMTSSIDDRLELLAGLLDTDGSYDRTRGGFEFSQKSLEMTLSVKRVAESLGFACSIGKQKNNKFGNCYRLYIYGEGLEYIPCRLPRKQARPREQIKNSNRYSFEIELKEEDDFFGFEVDGDGRFILGNFVVTHNSGKSTLLRETMLDILDTTEDKIGIVSLEESPAETARKLVGMKLNKNPSNEEIPIHELKEGFDKMFGSRRIVLLDHQGSIDDGSIVDQLEYMALVGCKYLFIDHITILVSEGSDGLTGNEAIDKVMNDLLRLVKRHDVWIGLVSHLRKAPVGGKSFEEGKMPSIDDIRGSGSIKQISFDIIAFARNLTAKDEKERNHIKMSVLKARHTGLTGPVKGALYDHATGRLKSHEFEKVETENVFG